MGRRKPVWKARVHHDRVEVRDGIGRGAAAWAMLVPAARRCHWPDGGHLGPSPDGDGMFTRTGRMATGGALLALTVSACRAGSSTSPGATGGSTGSGGGSAGSITIGLFAEPASLDFT